MPLFKHAAFHTTVANLNDLPGDSIGEVAFAGRSNAGKSSAINTLADHTRLAYVSKTPGRTQHLNYFNLGEGRYWVDLPGYGYARCSKEERLKWARLLEYYLANTQGLTALALLLDSRLPPQELDIQMAQFAQALTLPLIPVFTKCDKPRARDLAANKDAWEDILGGIPIITCSAQTKKGLDELWKALLKATHIADDIVQI